MACRVREPRRPPQSGAYLPRVTRVEVDLLALRCYQHLARLKCCCSFFFIFYTHIFRGRTDGQNRTEHRIIHQKARSNKNNFLMIILSRPLAALGLYPGLPLITASVTAAAAAPLRSLFYELFDRCLLLGATLLRPAIQLAALWAKEGPKYHNNDHDLHKKNSSTNLNTS